MFNNVRELCEYVGSTIGKNPVCIETGSTYVTDAYSRPHTSTNNIVKYICAPNNGILYSLDIDSKRQELGASLLSEFEKTEVKYILGDSIMTLKRLARSKITVDFILLDSKDYDMDHMVNEFEAIKNNLKFGKHIICVDDIHNPSSNKYMKMVPILKNLSYKHFEMHTPTGLFVAYLGYSFD